MSSSIADLRARAMSPGGRKAIKYTLVSVISVAVSLAVLVLLNGVLRLDAVVSNILSVTAGGIPSFWLNRRWVWGKTGESHIFKEHLPFWAMNFTGLALSTWWVAIAEKWGLDHLDSHALRTLLIAGANLSAFGVLWVGKFMIFNRLFRVEHVAQP
jgi:putative flippase GtrA